MAHHPLGQILIVTTGVGRMQLWDGQVEEIPPGDVIESPRQKHWPGAGPHDGYDSHRSAKALNGRNVDWLEKGERRAVRRAADALDQLTTCQDFCEQSAQHRCTGNPDASHRYGSSIKCTNYGTLPAHRRSLRRPCSKLAQPQ